MIECEFEQNNCEEDDCDFDSDSEKCVKCSSRSEDSSCIHWEHIFAAGIAGGIFSGFMYYLYRYILTDAQRKNISDKVIEQTHSITDSIVEQGRSIVAKMLLGENGKN